MILDFLARFAWGQRLIMGLFLACGTRLFPFLSLWPGDAEFLKVIIFAKDDFSWKSCMSSWRDD